MYKLQDLKTFPQGSHVIPKGRVTGLFNYAEKMGISKFWKIWSADFEEKGDGRGIVFLHSIWSLKKDTETFNFRSNQSFPDNFRRSLPIIRYHELFETGIAPLDHVVCKQLLFNFAQFFLQIYD